MSNTIQPTPIDADVRACITVFDNNGIMVERSYGPSPTELKEAHDNGTCDMWCDFCYEEAMKSINL